MFSCQMPKYWERFWEGHHFRCDEWFIRPIAVRTRCFGVTPFCLHYEVAQLRPLVWCVLRLSEPSTQLIDFTSIHGLFVKLLMNTCGHAGAEAAMRHYPPVRPPAAPSPSPSRPTPSNPPFSLLSIRGDLDRWSPSRSGPLIHIARLHARIHNQ